MFQRGKNFPPGAASELLHRRGAEDHDIKPRDALNRRSHQGWFLSEQHVVRRDHQGASPHRYRTTPIVLDPDLDSIGAEWQGAFEFPLLTETHDGTVRAFHSPLLNLYWA